MFDSGIGGLTVLGALEAALPSASFMYLGDSARLPYGTKSPQTIERYALGATSLLVQQGISALVVACNTASAVALPALSREVSPVPVFGVVEPGARTACSVSSNGRIAVLATESTVRGGAYVRAILEKRPNAHVVARSASLLVTLAEDLEGQDEHLCDMIVQQSLRGLIGAFGADTLLLGCTHFPALRRYFEHNLPSGVTLVDSAAEVAREVSRRVSGPYRRGRRRTLLTTDNVRRFARIGSIFLGEQISTQDVALVEIPQKGHTL